MKNFKIKLSVLALACLGAGALALQPAAYAKAEGEEFDASGLTMVNGAAVCVSDQFSGIRWTTKIDADWYAGLDAEKTYNFGVIVAPTAQIGTDNELTHADTACVDLPFAVAVDEETGALTATNYYSAINYNNITSGYGDMSLEEVLAKAYAMELTARAYVQVDGGEYYYASLAKVETSRSARQVAIAAEIDGDLDKFTEAKQAKAAGYYGESARLTYEGKGSIKSDVIDLSKYTEESEQKFTIDLALAEGETVAEAYLGTKIGGSQKLTATYNAEQKQLTITLPEGKNLPTGEHYVTLFTASGEAMIKPVIFATMVFDSIDDFDMFSAIRENLKLNSSNAYKIYYGATDVTSEEELSKYKFDGYYVLGKDLTYDAEKDKVLTDVEGYQGQGWYGTGSFAGTGLGLTGTFNGMGYWIRGYEDQRSHSGLFQIVNGGTIKNVYMYGNYHGVTETTEQTTTNEETGETTTKTTRTVTSYATNAAEFAYIMIDPKIENVFIYNKYFSAQSTHHALANQFYQTKKGAAKLSNLYIRAEYTNVAKSDKLKGGLFAAYGGKGLDAIEWSNVYVASNMGVSFNGATKLYMYYNSKDTTIYLPKFLAYTESQKTENGYTHIDPNTDAPVEYTVVDGVVTATYTYKKTAYNVYTKKGDQTTTTLAALANAYCLKGVYCYYSNSKFQADAANLDFSAFTGKNGDGCWTINDDGYLAWNG